MHACLSGRGHALTVLHREIRSSPPKESGDTGAVRFSMHVTPALFASPKPVTPAMKVPWRREQRRLVTPVSRDGRAREVQGLGLEQVDLVVKLVCHRKNNHH